ncbi:hypothetical protein GCM10027038_34590 [Arthrobacter bambusae]
MTVAASCTQPATVQSSGAPSGKGLELALSNVEPTQTFNCLDPIRSGGSVAAVTSSSPVLNVMALSATTGETIGWGGASYEGFDFAKVGIAIRSGMKFDLRVSPEWQDKMRIGWGNSGYTLATTVHVPGCSQGQQTEASWLVYPGGFWLKEPACVPLIVETETEQVTLNVAIGKNCP